MTWMRQQGLPTAGVRVADGSGLDRANRVTSRLLTALMLRMEQHPYAKNYYCLLYTSPSPRDGLLSRMPSSA